jgi:CRISPR/Cas system endoribonuclease Cas6 (RAMP superfamily)
MDAEKDRSLEELKKSLINKYKEMFIEKLTRKDLDEFQFYLKKQYDNEHGWNREYRMKFELKLRQYFHEEVLRREIASIETLLTIMQPQDLGR